MLTGLWPHAHMASCEAFTAIDVWYVLQGKISRIYLADAAAEIGLVLLLVSGHRAA